MARRFPHLLALVAIALLSLPTPAHAAYTARVEQPGNTVVTGAGEIHVRVSRDLGDVPVTALRVRPATGGQLQPTTCISDCDRGSRAPLFAFVLDPRTGAPFGDAAMPNGEFEVEGVISREIGEDRSIGRFKLTLRVPGSAVGGLSATTNGDAVRLAWSRAPEPDIVSYRVERCAGTCASDGSWTEHGQTAPSASSFDDVPGVGTHSYRIVTVRDGGGNGSIETVSAPVSAEVLPAPTASRDTRADGAEEDGGRDGSDTTTGSAAAPDRDDAAVDEGGVATAPAAGPARDGGPRTGKAPSVLLGRGGAGIPDLPGLGDMFRSELDYSTDVADGAIGEEDADEVLLSAPGSGGSFLGQLGETDRVAVPIAGGLLMSAIGLHLWRWSRVPMDYRLLR